MPPETPLSPKITKVVGDVFKARSMIQEGELSRGQNLDEQNLLFLTQMRLYREVELFALNDPGLVLEMVVFSLIVYVTLT